MFNRFRQLALRLAYITLKSYWYVARPASRGAYVAVWVQDRILLIQNSYKFGATFPAGGLNWSESYLQAARRELEEEVGISVPQEKLIHAGSFCCEEEFKRDSCEVFELMLNSPPAIRIDNVEVVHAEFLTVSEAFEKPLVGIVRQYLTARTIERDKPQVTTGN